jgi:hypothetical protein
MPVFANCVSDTEQDELLRLVEDLKKAGAKFKTTAAHGGSLQQFWLGFSGNMPRCRLFLATCGRHITRLTRTMSSKPRQTPLPDDVVVSDRD